MLPIGGDEAPTEEQRRIERLLLGLRMADGVPVGWVDLQWIESLVSAGLAERRNDHLSLTERGMLLANEVILALAG